ncbi:hypothetical protein HDE_10503 [Halotydeus destructor]|nr:hypothetical protein HDE_10503 [Halotydeus destructor]
MSLSGGGVEGEALVFQMNGVQGFARLCPGDMFLISLKIGAKKWKTVGRVLADGSQQWDQSVWTCALGRSDTVLHIKAHELKGRGPDWLLGRKRHLLSRKAVDVRQLLLPVVQQQQLMTVNLNACGTLKLQLVVGHRLGHHRSGSTSSASVRLPPPPGSVCTLPRPHRRPAMMDALGQQHRRWASVAQLASSTGSSPVGSSASPTSAHSHVVPDDRSSSSHEDADRQPEEEPPMMDVGGSFGRQVAARMRTASRNWAAQSGRPVPPKTRPKSTASSVFLY